MQPTANNDFHPQQVLDLWFPDNGFDESIESIGEWIQERMYGGMDQVICQDFADLTVAAAACQLDHWAETPDGRIALLIALDQFPRSLWRDTPAAYAQDIKSNLLVLEAVENGHFAALTPWKKLFCCIALGHCEGPDHLERFDLIDELSEILISELPEHISPLGERLRAQNARVRANIETFGRHPHRNPHYGRVSSPAEEAYIATGDFPHVRKEE